VTSCNSLKPGATATPAELRDFLAPQFAKFWLPDAFEFVDARLIALGFFMCLVGWRIRA
jgi:hypothetical protein